MKRLLVVAVLGVSFLSVAPSADAARVRVVHRGRRGHVVVVHQGFPIHRAFPEVWVRPGAVAFRVAPAVFLPPVIFGSAIVVSRPVHDAIIWQGGESLVRENDWTEVTLNVDQRGKGLLLEIERGRAQVNFAEVVFENGDAQVVDFEEKVFKPGLYQLRDFSDGRKVDHVRIVARAKSDEANITVRMVK